MVYHWLVPLLLVSAFAPQYALAAFIVDNFVKPALTCEPFLIQWQGGTAPWTISVLDASNSHVVEALGTFPGTSATWTIDVAANEDVLIQAQDSTGATALSQKLTIQAGQTGCFLRTLTTSTTSSTTSTTSSQTSTTTTAAAATTSSSSSSTTANTASNSTKSASTSSTANLAASASANNSLTSTTTASGFATTGLADSTPILGANTTTYGSGTGSSAESTSSPLNAGALKSTGSNPSIGLILGIAIPGLLLLLVLFILLMRRRRKVRERALDEFLGPDSQNAPAWYMRPDAAFDFAPDAGVGAPSTMEQTRGPPPLLVPANTYGQGSTRSYRTSVSSDSMSAMSVPPANYAQSGYAQSGYTTSSASQHLGERAMYDYNGYAYPSAIVQGTPAYYSG